MVRKNGSRHPFRLRMGLSLVFFALSVFLLDVKMALPAVLAAGFHECGHLLAARLLKIDLTEMKLDLFGARLSVSSADISYHNEFLLSLSGPLFSFLLAPVSVLFPENPFLQSLSFSSFFLGMLNLIPVRGFDGGRMLYSALSFLTTQAVADFFERLFTGAFLIILWGLSVYLMLLSGGGLSLFVFSVGFFCKIFLS